MKTCVKTSLLIFALWAVLAPNVIAAPLPAPKPTIALSVSIPPPPKKYKAALDGSLSQKDIALYRAIFAAQKKGRMDSAQNMMGKLSDRRLTGHVLYQRYMHPTAYISKFDELKKWLDMYADQPGADKIYELALRKGSAAQKKTLRQPVKLKKIVTRAEPTMVQKQPFHKQNVSPLTKTFEKSMVDLIRSQRMTAAIQTITKADQGGKVSKAAIDYYKAKIAESYLYQGNLQAAYDIAQPAFKRSGDKVPLAGWVCGLVSWYNQDYSQSAHYFSGAAESGYASGWMQAASSYWAARSYTRTGSRRNTQKWLARAQEHPRTFYGLLATLSSGQNFSFDWEKPRLTKQMRKDLAKKPAVFRAFALLEAGQKDLAEQEIVHIDANDLETRKILLALASEYDLPAVSIRLGSLLYKGDDHFYDAALYPDITVSSHGLYKIDPALILAIARQESRFETNAESRSGARGLMQIMPTTARYVAQKHSIIYAGARDLSNPVANMNLGQYYINDLLTHPNVQDDLVSTLIAYNAGPGNLGKWKRQWSEVDDKLLFIELLPSAQTREYVERVLSNYWIYRLKQGRNLPTMKALARGDRPTYSLAAGDLPFAVALNAQ